MMPCKVLQHGGKRHNETGTIGRLFSRRPKLTKGLRARRRRNGKIILLLPLR
jgi:hypothetical protein